MAGQTRDAEQLTRLRRESFALRVVVLTVTRRVYPRVAPPKVGPVLPEEVRGRARRASGEGGEALELSPDRRQPVGCCSRRDEVASQRDRPR